MRRYPHSITRDRTDRAYVRRVLNEGSSLKDNPDMLEEASAILALLAQNARCNKAGVHVANCSVYCQPGETIRKVVARCAK